MISFPSMDLSFLPWWAWLLLAIAFWVVQLLFNDENDSGLISLLLMIVMLLSVSMAVIRWFGWA